MNKEDPITQLTDTVYAVKVPDNASCWIIETNKKLLTVEEIGGDTFDFKLPPGQWRLIGNAKDVSADIAKTIVEKHSSRNAYRAYNYGNSVYCSDPLYSLDSLLKSKECTDGEIILIEKIK